MDGMEAGVRQVSCESQPERGVRNGIQRPDRKDHWLCLSRVQQDEFRFPGMGLVLNFGERKVEVKRKVRELVGG